ncbi:hypothetical protein ACQ4OD_08005 [Pseudomonas sp. WC1]|uniref:hypothetical protein n=1 Tax=unclassified Pseudomonas TaxID=196821 RepID=UPI0011195ACA|nr:hypothetical protein [Pseudomonas sp. F16(2018)]
MQFEKTYQVIANRGIVLDVHELTIHPADRAKLAMLDFTSARQASYRVTETLIQVYDRMQTKGPCQVRVSISMALTREQADALNDQRGHVSALISTSIGVPVGLVAPITGAALGVAIGPLASSRLPTYHMGDRMVHVEASVSGGIGPQRSSQSLIIQAHP